MKSKSVGKEGPTPTDRLIGKWELRIYWNLFRGFIVHAIYSFYWKTTETIRANPRSFYFGSGWTWLWNRGKDITDGEWELHSRILLYSLPVYVLHVAIAQGIRKCRHGKQILPIFYYLTALSFTWYWFSYKGLLLIVLHQVLGYAVVFLPQRKLFIWIFNVFVVYIVTADVTAMDKILRYIMKHLKYSYGSHALVTVLGWNCFRSLSFGLEYDKTPNRKLLSKELFLSYLAYINYMPLIITGPLIPFKEFEIEMFQPFKAWTKARFLSILKQLSRYISWMFVYDAILQVFYLHIVQMNPDTVRSWGTWELSGMLYCSGVAFFLKYFVMYGISCTLTQADGYSTPGPPSCLGRLHLFSNLWRDFDRGLYVFLVRYLYVPLMGISRSSVRKFVASAICFSYIYLWHGTTAGVLYWSFTNFVAVNLENCVKIFSCSGFFRRNVEDKLPPSVLHRVTMLLGSFMVLSYMVFSMFFVSGAEIAWCYVEGLRKAPCYALLTIIIVLYFSCNVNYALEFDKKYPPAVDVNKTEQNSGSDAHAQKSSNKKSLTSSKKK